MSVLNNSYSFPSFTLRLGGRIGDFIVGGEGSDNIFGMGGNDRLWGEGGKDRLFGGDGNDTLDGGADNDMLYGDAGNDVLCGGSGSDYLNGGSGADRYVVLRQTGTMTVIEGFETANAAEKIDLTAFSGVYSLADVTVTASPTGTVIGLGGGQQLILLGIAPAALTAGNFLFQAAPPPINHAPVAVADAATLSEDTATVAGNVLANDSDPDIGDTLSATPAVLAGTYGTLTLSANGSYSYALNTAAVQFLDTGASVVDSFTYTAQDNHGATASAALGITVTGLDDPIEGTGGNDTITGTSDDDLIFGYDGDDRLSGGDGNDTIYGGNGGDTVNGDAGNDVVYGGAGNDSINMGSGDDLVFGGDGNDTIAGTNGSDTIDGEGGDDRITGSSQEDSLSGGIGNDSIFAGSEDDRLFGADGADTLEGGTGNDTMSGGLGSDIFQFGGPTGNDVITDFRDDGGDVLRISGSLLVGGAGGISSEITGGDTLVTMNTVSGIVTVLLEDYTSFNVAADMSIT